MQSLTPVSGTGTSIHADPHPEAENRLFWRQPARLVHTIENASRGPAGGLSPTHFCLSPDQHHPSVHNDRSQCPPLVLSSCSLWHLPLLITMLLKTNSCLTSVVKPSHTQQAPKTLLGNPGPFRPHPASPTAQLPLPKRPTFLPVLSSSSSNPLRVAEHAMPSPASAALPVGFLLYSVQLFKEVESREDLAPGKVGHGNLDYPESVARSSLALPCGFPRGSIALTQRQA